MQIEKHPRNKAPRRDPVAAAVAGCLPPMEETAPLRVAAYLRYSTDGQKATSIADQLRSCREAAARLGLTISPALTFADDAISGSGRATHQREQYHALRAAVRAGQVDVIICDQQCRLARNAKEALTFFEELQENRVRLVTADGFDSQQPTSQLLFGIRSVFSEFFLDETRHRVRRGMQGEYERGSMVTAVPYGYTVDANRSAKEGRCIWAVDTEAAKVVQEIFRSRKEGKSFSQIAAALNGRKVPPPRANTPGGYWRASAIWRLLRNTTYKGLYEVRFGAEQGEGRVLGQRLMPELALVSAADWAVCQPSERSPAQAPGAKPRGRPRADYGGGRHAFAGLIQCGVCGAFLSCHHANGDKGTMNCVQCEHATADGITGRKPRHLSVQGVRQMLRWLLEKIITGEALARYRDCLRARLAGGQDGELAAARQELDKATRSRERLGRLLREIGDDDAVLEHEFRLTREAVLVAERKVQGLETGLRELDEAAIRRQLDIDVSTVIDAFLADSIAPERTRALLNRIFPVISLETKTDCYTSIFRVEAKPGAILAEATATAELADGNVVLWVRLQTSSSKRPTWAVTEILPPNNAGEVSVPASACGLGALRASENRTGE